MKPATRFLLVLALAAALGPMVHADDTDIYLDPVQPTGSEPLVMFTLDYRANMGAVQCTGFVNVASNGTDGIKETCGYSDDLSQELFDQDAGVEGSGPTKITLYELIRAALAFVLEDVSGVKVGIMMPHENTTAGGGCDPGDAQCSSGAMVMMGLTLLEDMDANGAKQLFKDTLRSIPATTIAGLPDFHPYQLKEMYFEFFRYLTGQKIVYGHQGWLDFDDSNAAKTVNLDGPERMDIVHQIEIGQGGTKISEGTVLNAGSTTTVINLDGVSAQKEITTANIFDNTVLRMLDGPAAGEERAITAYPGGPARQATVSLAFSAAPASGDAYEIVERHYPQWDASIEDGSGNYVSPLASNDCAEIFMINIGFGTANGDADLDAYIQGAKSAGAPDSSGGMGITLAGSNTQAQVIKFMNDVDLGDGTWGVVGDLDGDQNVVSYFIMQSANNTQHQWADAGGTGNAIELGTDPDALIETLQNIFKSILSVSTTFVAPSVPVNVFNRAQIVNEVFLALFEADETGLPFWNGNLKKVVIGENAVTGNDEIQDANGNQAIDVDGRLRRDAVTFWTEVATLGTPAEDEVAGADGRAITRGGAGQHIAGSSDDPQCANNDITPGGRNLYTEDPGENLADSDPNDDLMPLDCFFPNLDEIWTDLTANYVPPPPVRIAGSADETEAILDYFFFRGLEADGTTPRQWMLGDPLHSRPRPINYGARTGFSATNPDIRIVMGSNDGFMHMFQNTDSSSSDTGVPDSGQPGQSGIENWAFIPRAALKTVNRLQNNVAGLPVHPNTTDGSPVVLFKDDDNSGTIGDDTDDRVIVYFGMRRGGANLYALDITNPDDPKFLWRIIGGSGDFAELTQTWSTPQIGKVRLSGIDTDVLVFGGGYNGDDDGDLTYTLCNAITGGVDINQFDDKDGVDEDDRTECFDAMGKDHANRIQAFNKSNDPDVTQSVGTNDPHGNAIYIVNALTGALIWKAAKDASLMSPTFDGTKTLGVPNLNDSFPSEITAVDTTGNGILDRILAADTGGNVWRIDLGDYVDDDSDITTADVLVIDDISAWQIVKLLNAGRFFTSDVANDRRFFNRVDIAQTRDDSGPFDAVLVGSGDRENPLETASENWFYMIKDRQISVGAPPTTTLDHDDLVDLSDNCLQTDTVANCLDSTEQSQFEDGWRIQLNAASGEKNLAAAVTAGGNVFFTTFAPEPISATCGLSEGIGRFYALSLSDATAIINFDTSNDGGGTTYERFDTLGSGGIPVEVVPLGNGQILVQGQEVGENIVATGGRTGFRTYWYEVPEL